MVRFAEQLQRFFYDPDEDAGALAQVGVAEEPAPTPPEERAQEYLSFWLGPECYAVPIGEVREIVRVPVLTEVPRAERSLLGVMNLRGEVLPVYDLKLRLGLSDGPAPISGPDAELSRLPKGARVLVLRSEEGDAGVLVDAVTEVARLPPSAIEPPPAGTNVQECVVGLGRRRDQLFIVLDPQRALA